MEEIGACVYVHLEGDPIELKKVLAQIINDTESLEDGALLPITNSNVDAKIYEIPLDTKYYVTRIQFWVFNNFAALKKWRQSLKDKASAVTPQVLAFVVEINIANFSIKFMEDLKKIMRRSLAETQVLLINGNTTNYSSLFNALQSYCSQEAIELVELQPDEPTKSHLNEFCESYGVERLLEILGTVEWPNRTLKPNPTNRQEHHQRLKSIIEEMEKGNSNFGSFPIGKPDDLNLNLEEIPETVDNAEILAYFGHILDDPTVFPSDPNLEKTATVSSSISTKLEAADSEKQKTVEKVKTIKDTKVPLFNDDCFVAEDGTKTGVKLTDILESVLREHGRSVTLPFSLDVKSDDGTGEQQAKQYNDISSMLGQLNELKNQSEVFKRDERVSFASKLSLSVLETLTQSDSSENETEFGEIVNKKIGKEKSFSKSTISNQNKASKHKAE